MLPTSIINCVYVVVRFPLAGFIIIPFIHSLVPYRPVHTCTPTVLVPNSSQKKRQCVIPVVETCHLNSLHVLRTVVISILFFKLQRYGTASAKQVTT